MQIYYGDVKGEQPSYFYLSDRLKWDAWRDQSAKKQDKVQCMWKFVCGWMEDSNVPQDVIDKI